MDLLPPPLPKVTQGMVPLRDVIQQVIYHIFSELQNILELLPSMSNVSKKRTILEYIFSTKRKIIKLYVLVKWAYSSEEVQKCIDIIAFLQGQKNCFLNVIHSLKATVCQLSYARVRSPDIITAMEVLSTGTFPRLKFSETSVTFITPEILNPNKVLQTFNILNILISLRLSLYQVLPYSMLFYVVENGRAKFLVENEFVIYLSFVGEDISKTNDFLWFLVDFEWNFEGAPPTNDDIKNEIEKFGNEILKSSIAQKKEPLVELYNFLHKFTLFYKLEIIVIEAKEMVYGKWKNRFNVSFDSFKRSLTLKYWPMTSMKKNISWPNSIRIYIDIPKKKNIAPYIFPYNRISFDYDYSVITYSWKIGDEFQSCDNLNINETNISAKEIVSKIISAHSMLLLKKIYSTLLESGSFSIDSVFISSTGINNEIPVLKIRCSKAKNILIFINPICGKFKLMESDFFLCSPLSIKNYGKLINIPNQNILEILIRLKCKILYDDIESKAKFLGWDVVKFPLGSFKQKDFKDSFGSEIKYTIFLTNSILGWKQMSSKSIFFVVCFLSGQNTSWWLLEVAISRYDIFLGWNILWSEKIQIHYGKKRKFDEPDFQVDPCFSPTYSLLESIYKYSIIRVAILQFSRDLDRRGIHYGYLHDLSMCQLLVIPFFYFYTNDISPMAKVWICKNMFAQFSFSKHSFDELKIIFCGKLINLKFISTLLRQYKKDDIELCVKSKHFLIKITYKMGKNISSVIDMFLELWLKIETVIRLVFKSNEFNHFLVLSDFNIDTVRFSYYKRNYFWLEIGYDSYYQKTNPPLIKYCLEIGAMDGYMNPHSRIKAQLCQILEDSRGNIHLFAEIVYKTLPFLEVVGKLEEETLGTSNFHVLFQSSLEFIITYTKNQYALGVILKSAPSNLLNDDAIALDKGTLVYYIFDMALKLQSHDFLETNKKMEKQDIENGSLELPGYLEKKLKPSSNLKSPYNIIESCRFIWSKGFDVKKEYKKSIFLVDDGLICTSDLIANIINKIHTIIMG
ncbi:hypothetical protein MERGE_000939 [Pneumocystis wakefieldiae]|uniref:Mediator of RNA polymerase II transcription subunit 14 n=1 Tax=Pneumocystis wakefieldiae TaxID=38082 RepID=A0A899G5H8_9ASCO|nr:hypothetical protein MERGE_000939 [Pneumocystis wakefieldiae]